MELVLNSNGLQVFNLIVAFIIPTLVAAVTARFAAGWVKTGVLIFLAALLAVFSEAADKGSFVFSSAVLLFLTNVVVAIASHFGVTGTNALGLSGANGLVARKLTGGLGKKTTA